jgi:hypothetical protein
MAAVASPLREGMGSYSPLSRRVVLVRALRSHPNLVRALSQMFRAPAKGGLEGSG